MMQPANARRNNDSVTLWRKRSSDSSRNGVADPCAMHHIAAKARDRGDDFRRAFDTPELPDFQARISNYRDARLKEPLMKSGGLLVCGAQHYQRYPGCSDPHGEHGAVIGQAPPATVPH